jgi:uncharacterized protein (UPF0371 family)
MTRTIGFDNDLYLREQEKAILERMARFGNKLYLEFGGKLLFDYHAARVLPGYDPNVKMKLLRDLRSQADIILCIYAGDIERKKVRADFGITYDVDALKLIDDLRDWGIGIRAVVVTRFDNQPSAKVFKNKLERQGIRVYTYRFTKGYPTEVDVVVSDEGYGANDYIETEHPLAIVTGRNSPLMHASSALVLNAVKKLAGIPDTIHLLSPGIIESVADLKEKILGAKSVSLDLLEVLVCLSINAAANPMAHLAIEKLKDLQGCEVRSTHIPTPGDEGGLRRLGINLTSDPNFTTKSLFVS